jgi:hypothetical protein
MRISRAEFFHLMAGGSAWLVSSGFVRQIRRAVPDAARPLRSKPSGSPADR